MQGINMQSGVCLLEKILEEWPTTEIVGDDFLYEAQALPMLWGIDDDESFHFAKQSF